MNINDLLLQGPRLALPPKQADLGGLSLIAGSDTRAIAPDAVRAFGPPMSANGIGAQGLTSGDGTGQPPWNIANALGGLLAGLMSSLSGFLGQLSSLFGQAMPPAPSSEQNFASATSGSVGDPHESFTGTTANGATTNAKWDSMTGHADLLDSDSFSGGYRVSTAVTAPNAKGITLNGSAEVTTDNGATEVAMKNDGSYTIESHGREIALAVGQTVDLGNGETVRRDTSSLTVTDRNAAGGSISTTLKNNGYGGVDVTNSATNVDLGGYLVTHVDGAPMPVSTPIVTSPVSYEPYLDRSSESFARNNFSATEPRNYLGVDGDTSAEAIA